MWKKMSFTITITFLEDSLPPLQSLSLLPWQVYVSFWWSAQKWGKEMHFHPRIWVFFGKKKNKPTTLFFLQRTNCFVSPPVFSFSLLLSPLERGMIHRIYYMVDYWSNYIYMNTTWFTPKQCFMRMDRFKIQPLFRLMCLCVNTFLTFHSVSPQQIK